MRNFVQSLALATVALAITAPATATTMVANQQQISLASSVNLDLNTSFTNGGYYPKGGSTVTIGGVNFTLASYGTNGDAGIVSTTFNNTPAAVTVPVASLANVTNLYVLVNSAFGVAGQTIGAIQLGFTNGSSYSYSLTEGVNVRDHYNGSFNNAASALYGTASYGGDVRLDAINLALPAAFQNLTLSSIKLANTNPGGGDPFIAGITATTGAVPEPGTWATMIAGFGMVGGALRRRRATRAFA